MYHPTKDTIDILFEACLTYEPGQMEPIDFLEGNSKSNDFSGSVVWILGKDHFLPKCIDDLHKDISSRLWLSYRKGFQTIGNTNFTSDKGWGCMLRCGQMILAESLIRLHLGRDWLCSEDKENIIYKKILKLFEDKRSCTYSIHQIALMGVCKGKTVGQWFGPNTIGHVLRQLSTFDSWNDLRIHVAMDTCLTKSDVENVATMQLEDLQNFYDTGKHPSNRLASWRPVLVIIPLRVGLCTVNPIYVEYLKACFECEQSVGIIGGKPNQALYFIGYAGEEVVFLDPHVCQPCTFTDEMEDFDDSSYHCTAPGRIPFLSMDPSLALCFFCKDEREFKALCVFLEERVLKDISSPLFEITQHRLHTRENISCRTVSAKSYSKSQGDEQMVCSSPSSEEEYELIEAVLDFEMLLLTWMLSDATVLDVECCSFYFDVIFILFGRNGHAAVELRFHEGEG
ncbi:hypothetical protein QYM36_012536 [Artemia franciscana]|uniref:Cysteine protease n=2 Tax=Artemia franciscana TaxID=6661 RepID=A0AA88HG56_ARTSF|nr:hypothetical protein QYM36_012536 [Artemia franciscana]